MRTKAETILRVPSSPRRGSVPPRAIRGSPYPAGNGSRSNCDVVPFRVLHEAVRMVLLTTICAVSY